MYRYTAAYIHIVAGRLCPYFGFWKDQHENHEDILATELCIDMFVDMSEMKPKMLQMRPQMAMTRANMVQITQEGQDQAQDGQDKTFWAGRLCPYFGFWKSVWVQTICSQ